MEHFRHLLTVIFLVFLSAAAQGQEKQKVYCLVDTVNISRENRVVEISGKGQLFYTFSYPCPGKRDITFSYLSSRSGPVTKRKPAVEYVSWKQLLQMVDSKITIFHENYELYITEVLPHRRYKTTRVFYEGYRETAY